VLHVLREKPGTAGLLGGTDDERVPEGEVVEAVPADGGEDIGNVGSGDVEFGEETGFAACDGGVHAQFARDGDRAFLQDPERDYAVLARRCSVTSWTARRCLARAALSSVETRMLVSKKLRAGMVLPGMNLVSIEASPARVALTGQALKLFDAALRIVSASDRLRIVSDQGVQTLAEGFRLLSGASPETPAAHGPPLRLL
jgi:hypothetical protein